MIQLICNGVEVDVPRGTSIAWKNTNILFAFDKASCERSLTFTLPSTATNDSVFELCRLPQYIGQGFRRLYDAEYRDGLLVKRGYAYVTQSHKSGYNVTLIVGELTALKRLKDAGKVGDILPDAFMVVPKAVENANIAEYSGLKVLKVMQTRTQVADNDGNLQIVQLQPSWCFRPLLVDVLNELQVPFTLPSVAENLRIYKKGFSDRKENARFYGSRLDSAPATPSLDTLATDLSNEIGVEGKLDGIIEVKTLDLYAQSFQGAVWRDGAQQYNHNMVGNGNYNGGNGCKKWYYKAQVYHTLQPCTFTMAADYPEDLFLLVIYPREGVVGTPFCHQEISSSHWDDPTYSEYKDISHNDHNDYLGGRVMWKAVPLGESGKFGAQAWDEDNGIADTSAPASISGEELASRSFKVPSDCYFMVVRPEDYALACSQSYEAIEPTDGGLYYMSEYIDNWQPSFRAYEFYAEVKVGVDDEPTEWSINKSANLPDVTALDMLKTLANVSGKVLYYTDANGITFEDLLLTDFTPLDLTSKLISIKTLKPKFGEFVKSNIVKYTDDDMTTERQMLSVDYESNAAILKDSKDIYVTPFSCIAERDVAISGDDVVRRALIVNPDGTEQPSKDALLLSDANDVWLHRQPIVKNATIQRLCKEPLTIEATLHMSNYDYSQIQPFSLIHINGVDYVWTESSWQKGTATLTLSKLPLTLSKPRPTPPPAPYTYYDYLENNDKGQYIDTGVIVGGDCSIEIDYIWMSRGGGNFNIWICGASDSSSRYWLRSINGRFVPRYYNRDTKDSAYIAFKHGYSYQRHKNAITIYDGDSIFYTSTPTLRTISPAYTHHLFSMNNEGTPSTSYHLTNTRIGNVRIYNSNDVLIRDFRPAVRNADGVSGMHDVANDVFYTSANGVNFLYGNF